MFNRKNVGRLALGVALAVVGWGLLTWLLSPPRLPLQTPGVIDRLQRMSPDTKEDTRRYLYIDGKDRRLEVVFSDGCVGLRVKDENGAITQLAERKKDGSTLLYEVDGKLQLKRIVLLDKRGNLFSVDTVLGVDSYKREWYWPDGKTLRAVLEVGEKREVFSMYDEKGAKRFDDIEENTDDDPEGGYRYGRKQTVQTFTVYNGAKTPRFVQKVSSEFNYGNPQQPETQIESVDEYESGSTILARRITPKSSVTIGWETKKLTKVEVFSNGELRFTRYLDDKNRIVRMVEKTADGEVTTDVQDIATAGVEAIDPIMLQSPETPADLKLAEQMVAGNADMHLQRLLVP